MAHDPISDLKRFAAALEAQVSGDRSREAARMALHTPTPARSPRRVVVAIATTVVMGISNVALATVADPAVPGDALYGVDRAYERVGSLVGISDTHAGERASEFLVLQERGESARALELVQDTLTTLLQSDDPKAAVEEFTEALGSDRISDALGVLLTRAREVDTSGPEVSEAARLIVDSIAENLPDNAQGNPGGPAEPGPPDERGPATTPTPPDNPGQGKPDGETGQRGGRP